MIPGNNTSTNDYNTATAGVAASRKSTSKAKRTPKRRSRIAKKTPRRVSSACAREASTALVFDPSNAKLIRQIASRFFVEYDAVVSIAWISAFKLAKRVGLAGMRHKWPDAIFDQMRKSAELPWSRFVSLDDDGDDDRKIESQIAGSDWFSANPLDLLLMIDVAGANCHATMDEGGSDAVFQAHVLAKRMHKSERQARRDLARWRCQDWIRGEDD